MNTDIAHDDRRKNWRAAATGLGMARVEDHCQKLRRKRRALSKVSEGAWL